MIQGAGGKKELFYQVDPREKGSNRKRETFKTKSEAYIRVREIAKERKKDGLEALLTKEQRDEAAHCFNLLKPYNVTLSKAVDFFIHEIAAKDATDHERTVAKIADEWLVAKRDEKIDGELSPNHIADIRYTVEALKKVFPTQRVTAIETADIQNYLDSLRISQQTKRNKRNLIAQFFNFVIRKGYRKDNPANGRIIKVRVPKKEKISVLTVDQAKELMKAAEVVADGSLVPFFAFALFAGIRPDGELRRFSWEDVNSERIRIRGEIAKTGHWRKINPIPENLAAWIATVPEKKRKGLICPLTDGQFRSRYDKVRDKAGVLKAWDEDIMRHSFASYWIAVFHNREKLTDLLGHSEQMLMNHYREFIEEADAPAYWQIFPSNYVAPIKPVFQVIPRTSSLAMPY